MPVAGEVYFSVDQLANLAAGLPVEPVNMDHFSHHLNSVNPDSEMMAEEAASNHGSLSSVQNMLNTVKLTKV